MQKYIGIFLVLIIFTSSCKSKFEDGQFNFDEIEQPVLEPISPNARATGKKGFAITSSSPRWSTKLSSMKAHWYYSWGNKFQDLKPENVEFVPMQWGKWNLNDEKIAELKSLKEAGKIHYLLGYNEPDGEKQANMSVDEAIALWPKLEEVGLPLGSPAVVGMTNEWIIEFMEKANEKGLRVDFMAVHSYGGANSTGFINNLKDNYNLFGKPIWITEFAVADWTAESPEDNRFNPEQILKFMQEVLPQLEELDFVERYTWFSFGQESSAGTHSALYDADGTLTPLGQYYADFEPNLNIGPGKD